MILLTQRARCPTVRFPNPLATPHSWQLGNLARLTVFFLLVQSRLSSLQCLHTQRWPDYETRLQPALKLNNLIGGEFKSRLKGGLKKDPKLDVQWTWVCSDCQSLSESISINQNQSASNKINQHQTKSISISINQNQSAIRNHPKKYHLCQKPAKICLNLVEPA